MIIELRVSLYMYFSCSEIGIALQHSYFGPSPIFHYERLGCRGNENSLLECWNRKFATGDCNHGNEAGVLCAEPEGEICDLTSQTNSKLQKELQNYFIVIL